MTNIPVHITTPNSPHTATLTPFCVVNPKKALTGNVDGSAPWQLYGFYPFDTTIAASGNKTITRRIPDHNLSWFLPPVVLGADLDLAGSISALSLGMNFFRSGGSTNFGLHGDVGLFGTRRGMGVRFDAGLDYERFQSWTSSVAVVSRESKIMDWVISRSVDTAFFFDEISQARLGFIASLTLNSTFEEWPVNFFVQCAFHHQTFYNYVPTTRVTQLAVMLVPVQTDYSRSEVSVSSAFFSLAPGISLSLSKHIRFVSGVRLTWPLSDNIAQPQMLVSPFARIDFVLGNASNAKN
jgi:hypothetical protein